MKEIVKFSSNSLALPEKGNFQSMLKIHPQYVHWV